MNKVSDFSDDQLTAFLDGELEHIPADEIRTGLDRDPKLRARLDRLALDRADIAAAFDQLLAKAPQAPDQLTKSPPPQSISRTPVWHQLAAGLALGLALGWGASSLVPGGDLEDWQDYVSAYHALYAEETLAAIDNSGGIQQTELDRIAVSLGKDLDLQLLKRLDGLNYKRAQILGFEGRPLAQITFVSNGGAPIALCIIRIAGSEETRPALKDRQGMASASWSRDGYEYLLIGGSDRALVETAAGKLIEEL